MISAFEPGDLQGGWNGFVKAARGPVVKGQSEELNHHEGNDNQGDGNDDSPAKETIGERRDHGSGCKSEDRHEVKQIVGMFFLKEGKHNHGRDHPGTKQGLVPDRAD